MFDGPDEHIPALNEVKDIIEKQGFSDNVFAVAAEYANWETDEVIILCYYVWKYLHNLIIR